MNNSLLISCVLNIQLSSIVWFSVCAFNKTGRPITFLVRSSQELRKQNKRTVSKKKGKHKQKTQRPTSTSLSSSSPPADQFLLRVISNRRNKARRTQGRVERVPCQARFNYIEGALPSSSSPLANQVSRSLPFT